MESIRGGTVDYHLEMLRWTCELYVNYLPPENVIRYEDIVATDGKELSRVVPTARQLNEPLENKNLNAIYDRAIYDRNLMHEIAELLLSSEGPWWYFYERGEVEELLTALSTD